MGGEQELITLQTNGVNLRAAVAGDGPLVVLVHGWPELWYSWRHQIKPLAEAGYRVVVPDVRGYGGSDKPHPVEAYAMRVITDDVIGLIDAMEEEKAILVGHDWGAPICWTTAALHPDRIAAVAGLSVPFRKRAAISSVELWKKMYKDRFFYQLYFQEEGVAERELEADVRGALRKLYYAISGDGMKKRAWPDKGPDATLLEGMVDPGEFPAWMTEADLDYFTENFEAGGFRGPLNRYRNQQRDWEEMPEMSDLGITQPSYFIAGALDPVRMFVPGLDLYESAHADCTDFRGKVILDGIGHWVQQEAPDDVNRALLDFLKQL